MRIVNTALAFASVTSAFSPLVSSKAVEVCDVTTITVYETAYGAVGTPVAAKGTPTGAKGNPTGVKATPTGVKATPSAKVGKPFGSSGYEDEEDYSYKTKGNTVPSARVGKPYGSSGYEDEEDYSYKTKGNAVPSAKVGKPYGSSGYEEKEGYSSSTEGNVKLKPCAHWDHDTKNPKNLAPTVVGDKTQLYYAEDGNAHPNRKFYFGMIDLIFKAPAVVLEQSAYVTKAQYSNNQLVVDFSTSLACDYAKESWNKGTIIVSGSANCQKSSDDDHCYFQVDDLVKSADGKSIIVKGTPQTQNECTESGEATWGMYKPPKSSYSQPSQPGRNGTAGTNGTWWGGSHTTPGAGQPTRTSGATPAETSKFSSPAPANTSDSDWDGDFGSNTTECQAPVDDKYNLPSACITDFFDIELDKNLGSAPLSAHDLEFLREATTGLDSDLVTDITRRALLNQRALERRKIGKFLKKAVKKIGKVAVKALKTAASVTKTVVKGAVQLITTGKISGGINHNLNFAIPNGEVSAAKAKQVKAPWPNAVLLGGFTSESKTEQGKGVQREGYLNVYCVGCSASGRVELAGRATWQVGKSLTQLEVEAHVDMKAVLKIGIDAQIKLSREWEKNIFQIGLPGLSFGIVTIGPQIKMDSRITLEAEAKGNLLAGAELTWNRAHAKIDALTPSKSTRSNWTPIFHPVFDAEGELELGAELGLPIGIYFGISIKDWSKTVGLVNEPMIKAIAKAKVTASLSKGKIIAGFAATEGCTGIHTNLAWRNHIYAKVIEKQHTIFDTDYKTITSGCKKIGAQPQASSSPSAVPRGAARRSINARQADSDNTDPTATQNDSNNANPSTAPNDSTNVTPSTAPNDSSNVTPSSTPQANSDSTTPLPEGVRDITNAVIGGTEMINYPMPEVPTTAYTRTDGYEFTKLLIEDGEYNIEYCSNGNMYVKKTAAAYHYGCDELFAYSDDAIVGDAGGRYLSYYQNTMEKAGVSRLHLGDRLEPIAGTTAVALVAWNAAEAEEAVDEEIEGLYFAADYETEDVFWLTFCTYKDDLAPKVFVVKDLDAGIAVLKDPAVKFTITGGDVDDCYALGAKEDPLSKAAWVSAEDSSETTVGLEFNE